MSNAEKKAADTLLHTGAEIKIYKRSVLRFIGKKERTITIHQSFLGTLYEISRLALQMNFDESKVQSDPWYESKVLAEKHARTVSTVLAIAILNSKWKIRLFKKLLANYLYWHLTPENLFKIVIVVSELNNVADFINSIRSVRGWRITQPKSEMSPTGNGG
jgi:hypothetical protein